MSKYLFVTSFSAAGYEEYGRRFIEGFVDHFPKDVQLAVFHELPIGHVPDIQNPRVLYYSLTTNASLTAFLTKHKDNAHANGIIELADGSKQADYRFQATKFVRKVAAISSKELPASDWLIWIDADIIVKDDIPLSFFDELLADESAYCYYIGRPAKVWHHSECGFVAYNMKLGAQQFLDDFIHLYYSDQIFFLTETHDSFVFDYFRKQYQSAGYKFVDIAKGLEISHPWPETALGKYMTHLKGPVAKAQSLGLKHVKTVRPHSIDIMGSRRKNRPNPAKITVTKKEEPKMETPAAAPTPTPAAPVPLDLNTLMAGCKNRYDQLPRLIKELKPTTIVEIGTFKGDRAIEMVKANLDAGRSAHYVGYDIFEAGSAELNAAEFNGKGNSVLAEVKAKLDALVAESKGLFSYVLHPGNTLDTLNSNTLPKQLDFVFIDGGHSVNTIQNDYNAVRDAKFIALDDLYHSGPVDTAKFGCNTLATKQPNDFILLPAVDQLSHNGQMIGMLAGGAEIRAAIAAGVIPKAGPSGTRQQMRLKTKNCVEDAVIHANIRNAFTYTAGGIQRAIGSLGMQPGNHMEEIKELMSRTPVKFIPRACRPRPKETLVFVGGGNSVLLQSDSQYESHWKEITTQHKAGNKVVAVKSSYDMCLKHNIIPDFCILLDPRDHVATSIKDPRKETLFFISSMADASTWKAFAGGGYKVLGYHAGVLVQEDKLVHELWGQANMVHGGTTSGFRGIAVMYLMGWRNFEMVGFDSSYETKPEKAHGRSVKDVVQLDVDKRTFWSDPELLAQSQDSEAIAKSFPQINIKYHGDGMLQHARKSLQRHFDENPGDRTRLDQSLLATAVSIQKNDILAEALHAEGLAIVLPQRLIKLHKTLDDLQTLEDFINT